MTPQISPNVWSCLATAFAVVLDMPVRELFKEIGHDGSEIIFPDEPEPECRRSFHPQEFVTPCLNRGYALLLVEAMPILQSARSFKFHSLELPGGNALRIIAYTRLFSGVITGENDKGKPHALAWDGSKYYQNNGTVLDSVEFSIREFFAFVPLKQRYNL